jgi:hypothetical protein
MPKRNKKRFKDRFCSKKVGVSRPLWSQKQDTGTNPEDFG